MRRLIIFCKSGLQLEYDLRDNELARVMREFSAAKNSAGPQGTLRFECRLANGTRQEMAVNLEAETAFMLLETDTESSKIVMPNPPLGRVA